MQAVADLWNTLTETISIMLITEDLYIPIATLYGGGGPWLGCTIYVSARDPKVLYVFQVHAAGYSSSATSESEVLCVLHNLGTWLLHAER